MKITDLKTGATVGYKRANVAKALIVLTIIISAGIFISLYNFWNNNPSEVYNKWYNYAWFSVWIVSGITFSMWFYRAYANLKLMGIAKTKWDPWWAVIGVWVIVANLIVPYLIMRELNTLCVTDDKKRKRNVSLAIVWWLFMLISVVISWVAQSYTSGYVTYSEFKTGIVLHAIRYLLFLLSGGILIKLITDISQFQKAKVTNA